MSYARVENLSWINNDKRSCDKVVIRLFLRYGMQQRAKDCQQQKNYFLYLHVVLSKNEKSPIERLFLNMKTQDNISCITCSSNYLPRMMLTRAVTSVTFTSPSAFTSDISFFTELPRIMLTIAVTSVTFTSPSLFTSPRR